MSKIKVIVGLGNPGNKYRRTRHNIGFLVLEALADKYNGLWAVKGEKEFAEIDIKGEKIILIKPQTFMNSSGKALAPLLKQGVSIENVLVVHDELEKAFGVVDYKVGGSHRGHNGLRSIIDLCGAAFARLRCGIGRPDRKEDVPEYVLDSFAEPITAVELMIEKAVSMIETLVNTQ